MIRRATVADAAAVAGVALRAALHADELLDPDALEADPEGWAAVLDGTTVLAFEAAGRLGGVAAVGRGELVVLAVDPPAQGAGVGSHLLAAAEDVLRLAGTREASVWVPERDGLSRRFAQGRGWSADGERREDPWGPRLRYVKALGPAPPRLG